MYKINKICCIYFFLLTEIYTNAETYIYPVFEKKKIGHIEITKKFFLTEDKNNNFFNWDIQKLGLAILGFSALGGLGYAVYKKYTDNKIFQKMRGSIKTHLLKCINQEAIAIEEHLIKNQKLLYEYKKIIQQEKKNSAERKVLLLAFTGIISAIGAILIYNGLDKNNYNVFSQSTNKWDNIKIKNNIKTNSDNVKINSDNFIVDNSKNTIIINNNNNNNNDDDTINKNYYDNDTNKKLIIQKYMNILAEEILLIIIKSKYFQSNYNIFLDCKEYLENDCPYINSQEIESFFIEIILEIINEKLLSKK